MIFACSSAAIRISASLSLCIRASSAASISTALRPAAQMMKM
jgi:hypothetical protein